MRDTRLYWMRGSLTDLERAMAKAILTDDLEAILADFNAFAWLALGAYSRVFTEQLGNGPGRLTYVVRLFHKGEFVRLSSSRLSEGMAWGSVPPFIPESLKGLFDASEYRALIRVEGPGIMLNGSRHPDSDNLADLQVWIGNSAGRPSPNFNTAFAFAVIERFRDVCLGQHDAGFGQNGIQPSEETAKQWHQLIYQGERL